MTHDCELMDQWRRSLRYSSSAISILTVAPQLDCGLLLLLLTQSCWTTAVSTANGAAAVASTSTGLNTLISAVLVRVAVVLSVYRIMYLLALKSVIVPSHTLCSLDCFATKRPIYTFAHSLHRQRCRPCWQMLLPPHSLHLLRIRPC